MSRSLKDSEYLYGFHDPGGEHIMLDGGVPGWVLVTVGIGCDPNDRSGGNFTSLSDRGLGVMVRLNNGYEPAGTIPHSSAYEKFAKRCANYVQNSCGCRIWIIGNEMNHPVERPGGQIITPQMYARCYGLCRDEIHKVDPGAQVLVGAVAPWCAETRYAGNTGGDWVQYFKEILTLLSPDKCDGFTLHTYTHGDNPDLIASDDRLGSFPAYHYNFLAYRDFLNVVPPSMRSLPCYITETDQGDVGGKRFPWTDRNTTWIQRAYGEIDWWNRQPGNQLIRALILYRWSRDDDWYIEGKHGVIEDFKQALPFRYRWEIVPDPVAELRKRLETLETLLGKLQPAIQQIARLSATLAELQKIIDDLVKNAPSTASLTGQLDDLDKAIAQLKKDAGGDMVSQVPQPQLQDVRATLPKHPTKQYPTRPESAVRRIIVHHTATRADITPQRIAEVQIGQDRAGITYHFLVGGDGTIYWTQPFEAVTEQALVPEVNADGVAVALAGNFTNTVPSEAQMAGAAALIAWLLSKFGLTTEAVFGRREVETRVIASPGAKWSEFKPVLLAAAQEIIDRYPPVVDKDTLIAQLRQQVGELQALVAQFQQQNKGLADTVGQQQAEIVRLKAEIVRLNAEIVRLQTIIDNFGGGVAVPKPAIIDVVASLEKHPTLPPYPKRTKPISMIVIHHADTPKNFTVQQLAHYHVFGERKNAQGELVKEQWPGIGYHYVVAPDGKIYQGQRDETKSNQAGGEPNNYSIAISLIGRFMKKDYSGNLQVPEDQVPTPEQLRSASHLAAWLMQQYKVPIEKVVGHTDVWAAYPEYFTWCPGDQWKAGAQWRNTLRQQIQDRLADQQNVVSRQIEHYLLFWDHGGSEWAKADWQNAQAYIAHFRPTIGFSVEDALQARHVTIVGGDAGVSGKDEARLRAAGIGVYRLAGVNEADTRAKLDELIRNDTPWPGAPAPVRAVGEPIVSLPEIPEIIETPVPDEWTVPDDWTIGS